MVATTKNAANPGEPAVSAAAARTGFLTALGLYSLWTALATSSVLAGQTTLAPKAGGVLLVGIVATNALFLLIARTDGTRRAPEHTVTLAQCIMAITWTTLFTFMSAGPGELSYGMYITAILYAAPTNRRGALLHLAIFALVSYASVVVIKASLNEGPLLLAPELPGLLVLAGLLGALLLLRTDDTERQHRQRSAAAKDVEPRPGLAERNFIIESLEREKGRTDRSNNPFTVCIFAIDNVDQLMQQHGSMVGALVLQRFARRARGEMRAMDGMHRSAFPLSFDRVDAERYLAVLPQTNLAGAARCAERIRATIAKHPIDGQYAATVSCGVAEYRRGETVTSLMARAESKLCEAQARGGDRVCGHERSHEQQARIIPLHGRKT